MHGCSFSLKAAWKTIYSTNIFKKKVHKMEKMQIIGNYGSSSLQKTEKSRKEAQTVFLAQPLH